MVMNGAISIQAEELSEEAKADLAFEIGSLHLNLSNPQEALKYYEIALPLFRKIGDQQGESGVIGNIGLVYHDKGELTQARKYLSHAKEIYEKMEMPVLKSIIHGLELVNVSQ